MSLPIALRQQYKEYENQILRQIDSAGEKGHVSQMVEGIALGLYLAPFVQEQNPHHHSECTPEDLWALENELKKAAIIYFQERMYGFAYRGRERRNAEAIAICRQQERWEKYQAIRKRNYLKRTVYSQRRFPPALRHLVFCRDQFTCQICGRTKQQLIRENLHLEVDHIQEWEDGGETCYENGQTVCSECNKGKHFAKKYISEEKTA